MKSAADNLKALMFLGAAISAAVAAMMTVAGVALGLANLPDQVHAVTLEVAAMSRRQASIMREIEMLKPSPRVGQYDSVRSGVEGPCVIGQWCEYLFTMERTAYGELCGVPERQAQIINHYGLTHATDLRDAPAGRAVRNRRNQFSGQFFVPHSVRPGIGEFLIALDYPDCFPDTPQVKHRENTIALEFEIVAGGRPGN